MGFIPFAPEDAFPGIPGFYMDGWPGQFVSLVLDTDFGSKKFLCPSVLPRRRGKGPSAAPTFVCSRDIINPEPRVRQAKIVPAALSRLHSFLPSFGIRATLRSDCLAR
jgi:hypothetical protein